MSEAAFRTGSAYIGTSTISRKRQKVFLIVGRRDSLISVAHVHDVQREFVETCDGTEYVKVKDPDGYDYFISAQVGVDIDEAFNVVRMCRGES